MMPRWVRNLLIVIVAFFVLLFIWVGANTLQ